MKFRGKEENDVQFPTIKIELLEFLNCLMVATKLPEYLDYIRYI